MIIAWCFVSFISLFSHQKVPCMALDLGTRQRYAYMHTCAHAHLCLSSHVHVHFCLQMCMFAHMRGYIYACANTCVYTFLHTNMHTHTWMHACMNIYIYIYIHIYICVQFNARCVHKGTNTCHMHTAWNRLEPSARSVVSQLRAL